MNVAEVALDATVTEDGTINTVGALLARATTVLLEDVLDMVTEQVVLEFDARLAAAH